MALDFTRPWGSPGWRRAIEELNLDREGLISRDRLGYLLLKADGEAWNVTLRSPTGDVGFEFTVGGG